MKKRAKVHLLPTDKTDGTLWKTTSEQLIHTHVSGEYKQKYQPFNIYIVTDDEIKDGDWYYVSGGIGQPVGVYQAEENPVNNDWRHKIIATTDLSLTLPITEDDFDPETGGVDARILHQIPKSFIEEYCKAGGIDEVDVEYKNGELAEAMGLTRLTLKVNSYNEIIIHPIEEKSYTRKELYKLCKVAYRMGAQNHEDATVERLDEWFNLLK